MVGDVERVKARIDIVEVVGRSVQLKKSGRNFQGLCPFHGEHSPSFNVSPDRQIFKCFGCGVSGDVFNFIMQSDGITFKEALKLLADEAGVDLGTVSYGDKKIQSLEDRIFEINQVAMEYYHFLLVSHDVAQEARDYLDKRGIVVDWGALKQVNESSNQIDSKKLREENVVSEFKIGYSPRSWDSLGNFLLKRGFSFDEMLSAGLVVKSDKRVGSYYDMFRGRVMFPLFEKSGKVVGFSGRVLGDEKTAKYINTAETAIFHKREFLFGFNFSKEEIRKKGEAILVEGEMDMMSSYKAGVRNIVAVKGSALTNEQIEMLGRLCKRILLCFDNDSAGNMAIKKAIELAETKEMEVKVIQLKYGKDPDECIRKDVASWVESIAQAVPVYDYILHSALSLYSVKDPVGQMHIVEESLPLILQIKNTIIRGHYLQKLSTFVDVPEKELIRIGRGLKSSEVKAVSNVQTVSKKLNDNLPPAIKNVSTNTSRNDKLYRLERYFLSILIRLDYPIEGIERKLPMHIIGDSSLSLLYNSYVQFFANNPDSRVRDFLKNAISEDLLSVVDDLFLVDLDDDQDNELQSELFLAIKNLKEYHIREEIRLISNEMKKFDMQGMKEESEKLQARLGELLVKLGKVQKII